MPIQFRHYMIANPYEVGPANLPALVAALATEPGPDYGPDYVIPASGARILVHIEKFPEDRAFNRQLVLETAEHYGLNPTAEQIERAVDVLDGSVAVCSRRAESAYPLVVDFYRSEENTAQALHDYYRDLQERLEGEV